MLKKVAVHRAAHLQYNTIQYNTMILINYYIVQVKLGKYVPELW